MISMISSALGLSRAASIAVAIAVAVPLISGLGYCAIDAYNESIRKNERTAIENEHNRKRVDDLKRRIGTDNAVKEIGRRAKVWCASGLRECCAPGAGELLQCTKDPSD